MAHYGPVTDAARPLILPLQVAALRRDGTIRGVPRQGSHSTLLLEIGAGDRDTLVDELLPSMPDAFLVSCEPVLDKYARGLSRFPTPHLEAFQPLGHQQHRSLILPVAVGPVDTAQGSAGFLMEPRAFNIGWSTGCSSALNRTSSGTGARFGKWCRHSAEQRQVPMVPLSQILDWMGAPVAFAKIDTQGLDLEVVKSGGASLRHRVHRLLLEVVADDCVPIYAGQPNCSQVVATLTQLGYVLGGHVSCSLPAALRLPNGFDQRVDHSYCELDLLFVSTVAPPLDRTQERKYRAFHQAGPHGCHGIFESSAEESLQYAGKQPQLPPGTAVAILNHPYGGVAFLSDQWEGRTNRSFGQGYLCPRMCFGYTLRPQERRSLLDNASRYGGNCPWAPLTLAR